jgi:hypothetical protein
MQEATYHELARIEHKTKARVYAKHGMHGKAESHKLRAAHHANFGTLVSTKRDALPISAHGRSLFRTLKDDERLLAQQRDKLRQLKEKAAGAPARLNAAWDEARPDSIIEYDNAGPSSFVDEIKAPSSPHTRTQSSTVRKSPPGDAQIRPDTRGMQENHTHSLVAVPYKLLLEQAQQAHGDASKSELRRRKLVYRQVLDKLQTVSERPISAQISRQVTIGEIADRFGTEAETIMAHIKHAEDESIEASSARKSTHLRKIESKYFPNGWDESGSADLRLVPYFAFFGLSDEIEAPSSPQTRTQSSTVRKSPPGDAQIRPDTRGMQESHTHSLVAVPYTLLLKQARRDNASKSELERRRSVYYSVMRSLIGAFRSNRAPNYSGIWNAEATIGEIAQRFDKDTVAIMEYIQEAEDKSIESQSARNLTHLRKIQSTGFPDDRHTETGSVDLRSVSFHVFFGLADMPRDTTNADVEDSGSSQEQHKCILRYNNNARKCMKVAVSHEEPANAQCKYDPPLKRCKLTKACIFAENKCRLARHDEAPGAPDKGNCHLSKEGRCLKLKQSDEIPARIETGQTGAQRKRSNKESDAGAPARRSGQVRSCMLSTDAGAHGKRPKCRVAPENYIPKTEDGVCTYNTNSGRCGLVKASGCMLSETGRCKKAPRDHQLTEDDKRECKMYENGRCMRTLYEHQRQTRYIREEHKRREFDIGDERREAAERAAIDSEPDAPLSDEDEADDSDEDEAGDSDEEHVQPAYDSYEDEADDSEEEPVQPVQKRKAAKGRLMVEDDDDDDESEQTRAQRKAAAATAKEKRKREAAERAQREAREKARKAEAAARTSQMWDTYLEKEHLTKTQEEHPADVTKALRALGLNKLPTQADARRAFMELNKGHPDEMLRREMMQRKKDQQGDEMQRSIPTQEEKEKQLLRFKEDLSHWQVIRRHLKSMNR